MQHATMTVERWSTHPRDRQILMIANEMNRARKLMAPTDRGRLRNTYERVLALTDLTIRTRPRTAMLRELLRWRDLVATLFIAETSRPHEHDQAFRALLLMTPTSYSQLPYLLT